MDSPTRARSCDREQCLQLNTVCQVQIILATKDTFHGALDNVEAAVHINSSGDCIRHEGAPPHTSAFALHALTKTGQANTYHDLLEIVLHAELLVVLVDVVLLTSEELRDHGTLISERIVHVCVQFRVGLSILRQQSKD